MTIMEMKEIVDAINLLKNTLNDEQAKIVKMLFPNLDNLKKNNFLAKKMGFKFLYNNELYKTLKDNYKFDNNSFVDDTNSFIKIE